MNDLVDGSADGPDEGSPARVVRPPTLIAQLERLCHPKARAAGELFAPTVAWLQLDEVREHRDQLGFSGLERLMHALHERVRMQLESSDLTARFGLDCIAVLLDPFEGRRDFPKTLESIGRAVGTTLFEVGESSVAATATIGACRAVDGLESAEFNLVRAAQAAERALETGGNRVEFDDRRSKDGSETDDELRERLAQALDEGSLKVVRQPLLATNDDHIERMQILPRLTDESGGLIPAASFIPIAARHGLLPKLDRWMIGHAVELLGERIKAEQPVPLVFLNQSPEALEDAGLLEWLAGRLKRLGARDGQPAGLVLEFNVFGLKPRIKTARRVLPKLRELGVQIALSGVDEKVPEVVLLKHLCADFLRMKPDFARRLQTDEALTRRFAAFASTAHKVGRKLIVPMLEDADEVARIWRMDVDLIQGNFIQQPEEQPEPA